LHHMPEQFWRLVLILGASWLIAGGLLYALRRRRWIVPSDGMALPGAITPSRHLGLIEAAMVLGLVDLLFAAFVWVQFAYLFSGQAARTMDYETYRLYARQGFGELLVVSVLTLALILGLRWATAKKQLGEVYVFNGLCTAMVALAGVMLVSAFQRMLVWESVEFYINTQTRLYVRWFIIWLGLTYGWLLFTLWLRHDRFAIGAFVASLGFLCTVNVLNPDADVATYNLARRDELSTRYLALLSDDAVPTLAAGLEMDGLPPDVRRRLRDDLTRRLAAMTAMEAAAEGQRWPSFHLARWQARQTLVALRRAGTIE
ncbi:MAG: DUF4173 domain-containing protein, partial [Chloroflexota bacterium]